MQCSIAKAYYLRNITMKCTTYIGCGVLSTTVVQSWQSILIDTNSTSTRSNKHIVKNHCSALKWQWILQYPKPAVDFFTRHAKTVVYVNQAGMSCYDIISLELSWSMLFIQRLYVKGLDELLTTKGLTQPWDLYQLHSTCSLWLNQGVKGIPEENRSSRSVTPSSDILVWLANQGIWLFDPLWSTVVYMWSCLFWREFSNKAINNSLAA